MAAPPIPTAFVASYNDFSNYPQSLIPRLIDEEHDEDLFALYQKRLEDRQSSAEPLLIDDSVAPTSSPDLLPQIIIRDISINGSVLKKKIGDHTRLERHLAGFPTLAQAAWPALVAPDPRCRFVYLHLYLYLIYLYSSRDYLLTARLFVASFLREILPVVCK